MGTDLCNDRSGFGTVRVVYGGFHLGWRSRRRTYKDGVYQKCSSQLVPTPADELFDKSIAARSIQTIKYVFPETRILKS